MAKYRIVVFGIIACLLFLLSGCSDGSSSNSSDLPDPADPVYSEAVFSNPTRIDNQYLPMLPYTTLTFQKETEEGVETIIVEVLDETRVVDGVTAVVVRDRVYFEEELTEDTHDWFAQDNDGNIWYMGEFVINYELDDEGVPTGATDNDGSWEAGVDGAVAGILIKATPVVGDSYQQEFLPGEAEDMAKVVALNVTVTLADGTIYTDCVKTREWNPLEADSAEYKYYAPAVGLISEENIDDEETAELKGIFLTSADEVPFFDVANFSDPTDIDNNLLPLIPGTVMTYEAETDDGIETIVTEVLAMTKIVNGVECVVFNDKVYLDSGDGDVLVEDTDDWFAQDDDGNVWYMGEFVINYELDDDGVPTGATDNAGSWEAGVDGALPGITMWADPVDRTSYYQEYYEDEATDMGFVVASGVEVELADGSTYEDCLQVLDWNPLEPETLEYKYYAPEIGLVMEEELGGDDAVELISIE